MTAVAHYMLPPACIYILPMTIASPRNNPRPVAQSLDDVHLLKAFHECFQGKRRGIELHRFRGRAPRGGDTAKDAHPTGWRGR